MDSKEFGLVAAQQLFKIDDLHYGYWEDGDEVSFANFVKAQKKYTDFLCAYIAKALGEQKDSRILDSGCGVGTTLSRLLGEGYRADGLVPSAWMSEMTRAKAYRLKAADSRVYDCRFEDFPAHTLSERYQVVFFSESYQYIDITKGFAVLDRILKENGAVLILDFFKKDTAAGESALGGGHSISRFLRSVENAGYFIETDIDLTRQMSPNLALVRDALVERVLPFSSALDSFLNARYKYFYGLLRFVFRKKLNRIKRKYSPDRNQQNFEIHKTYRLFILRKKNVDAMPIDSQSRVNTAD